MLRWVQRDGYQEAILGIPEDGVSFTLTHHPTCYRRGSWRLYVEIAGNHAAWGCLDSQDQPTRWYHDEANAKEEAALIAEVLLKDREKS